MWSAAPVPLFHLSNQFVSRELSPDNQDKALDDILWAVHVQQATDHNRQTAGIHLKHTLMEKCHQITSVVQQCSPCMSPLSSEPHLLDINLDVLLQVVAVQVEDQVMDEVKTVTDDDERQLVSEFGFLYITHNDKRPHLVWKNPTQKKHISVEVNKHHLTIMQQGWVLALHWLQYEATTFIGNTENKFNM